MSEWSERVGSRAPTRASSPARSLMLKSSSQLSPLSRHRGARFPTPDHTERSSGSSPASTRGISPVGGSVQCGSSPVSPATMIFSSGGAGGGGAAGSGGGGSGGGAVPPDATGGLGTAEAGSTESGSGKRWGGRGPDGAGGTSPNRGASSGRRPATPPLPRGAHPLPRAAAGPSAPMVRTPSFDGLAGGRSSSSRCSSSGDIRPEAVPA